MMQTVAETHNYLARAKAVGMTAKEMAAVVSLLANDPMAGEPIVGSGGCRKVRVAGRGKGKSGGYRIVTFYSGPKIPVYLLSVLSKGSDANFSDAQVAMMAKIVGDIARSHGEIAE